MENGDTDIRADEVTPENAARRALEAALASIAPEVDLQEVDAEGDLRRQIDLDSVDVMNLLMALEESLGIEIPESDTSRMTTLDDSVRYLASRLETCGETGAREGSEG